MTLVGKPYMSGQTSKKTRERAVSLGARLYSHPPQRAADRRRNRPGKRTPVPMAWHAMGNLALLDLDSH